MAFTGAGRTLAATRRWGTTVEVRGRLATAPGTPIQRAQVDVLGQVLVTGARGSVLGAVHADDQGAFRYTVPAGVSQIVTFGYRRTLADRTYATTASVQARTRAGIVLRSGASQLRNGGSLLLRGRVSGAPRTSRQPVSLQARTGAHWTTFATTRLRGGAFAYRYRFTRTLTTTRYRLRALVERGPGWPLETGASAPIAVTVIA